MRASCWTIVVVILASLLACERGPKEKSTHSPENAAEDAKPSKDAVDASRRSNDSATADVQLQTPEMSPYICDGDGGLVHPRSPEKDFEKPPLERSKHTKTASEVRRYFNGTLPEAASFLTAASHLRPGRSIPSELFALLKEDVVLHLGTIHPADEFGESTISVTVLADYRPVEAVYKKWNGERTKVERRIESTGARFKVDEDIELVDIVIPAERFEFRGIVDLGVGFRVDGEVEVSPRFERIRLYRGSYDRDRHPCVELGSSELDELSDLEKTVDRKTRVLDAMVYPAEGLSSYSQLDAFRVSPGETIRMRYVLPAYSGDRPKPFALVPLVNGRPLDWRRFVVARLHPDEFAYPPAVKRGEFEVKIPDEPGEYEVQLGTWYDPFLLPSDEPGHGIRILDTTGAWGSNLVTLVAK